MRAYVSGPITGVEDHASRFQYGAAMVRQSGVIPVLPQDIPADHDGPCPRGPVGSGEGGHVWACHLRKDLRQMLDCDAVVMLPEWEHSHGARLEHHVAASVGIPIFYFTNSNVPRDTNGTPLHTMRRLRAAAMLGKHEGDPDPIADLVAKQRWAEKFEGQL
jgi:hypothetical protein